MKQRRKIARLNLRIDSALKAAAENAAAADQHSITYLIEKLLIEHLHAKATASGGSLVARGREMDQSHSEIHRLAAELETEEQRSKIALLQSEGHRLELEENRQRKARQILEQSIWVVLRR
jgi:hypothetical protein